MLWRGLRSRSTSYLSSWVWAGQVSHLKDQRSYPSTASVCICVLCIYLLDLSVCQSWHVSFSSVLTTSIGSVWRIPTPCSTKALLFSTCGPAEKAKGPRVSEDDAVIHHFFWLFRWTNFRVLFDSPSFLNPCPHTHISPLPLLSICLHTPNNVFFFQWRACTPLWKT